MKRLRLEEIRQFPQDQGASKRGRHNCEAHIFPNRPQKNLYTDGHVTVGPFSSEESKKLESVY